MVKILGKEVGNVGYGLMGFTWRPNPALQEQCFEAMRTALSLGATAWNGGEIYGTPERNSLHLLNEYFTKYPHDADKVVLSIKGGLVPGSLQPDSSKKNVSRSIEECLKVLAGKKFLDLFECARLDGVTPIEETIGAVADFVKAGKVGGISLSEVNANTIRKAHAVHPISAVEVELSLWSTEIFDNGIASTCGELGIPIVAYSPLGRGFLAGKYKSFEDLPEQSTLRKMPRFQPDVFGENIKLLHEVEKVASEKGSTPAQVALGWVIAHSSKKGMPEILPIPGATTTERVTENMKPAKLNDDDMAVMEDILTRIPIQGKRYAEAASKYLSM